MGFGKIYRCFLTIISAYYVSYTTNIFVLLRQLVAVLCTVYTICMTYDAREYVLVKRIRETRRRTREDFPSPSRPFKRVDRFFVLRICASHLRHVFSVTVFSVCHMPRQEVQMYRSDYCV